MKRGRRSARDQSATRLLDLWQREPAYGEPIGCVATTFTFDPVHFEVHCLSRFLGIETDPGEDGTGYLLEREERLAPVFAAVLVDQAHVTAHRSLRWNLLPVRVDGGGCLHAKVALLAWEHRIRVIVSSANLTEPGYRRNIEAAAHFDFTADGEAPLELLEGIRELLEEIRARAPGMELADGPQPALERFLRGIERQTQDWPPVKVRRGDPDVRLAVTGLGGQSLFEQVREAWSGPSPDEAWVVSPFFDDGEGALEPLGALESLMTRRGEPTIHLTTSGLRLDGVVHIDLPASLDGGHTKSTLRYRIVTPDPDEGPRALHAKTLWLGRGSRALFCVGSSNFTRAGTAHRDHGPINIEANVIYSIPDATSEFGRICDRVHPPSEEIDPAREAIQFTATSDRTPEPEGVVPLPGLFGAAVFRVSDGAARLDLELMGELPDGTEIRTGSGDLVRLALRETPPCMVEVAWTEPRAPSHLDVSWRVEDEERHAIWPVNVADGAALPPPDELRSLSLEDMVEVLTSSRPPHEMIAQLLRRRADTATRASGFEIDPHKRVETRHFLLKRMRRLSGAFEELRARLERPLYSHEALAWQLRGPLGPIALATRILADEPAASGFLIAELAESLSGLEAKPRGELTDADIQASLGEITATLRTLAMTHPAPSNLSAYVESVFEEVGR